MDLQRKLEMENAKVMLKLAKNRTSAAEKF